MTTDNKSLLERTQELMKIERSLSATIERVDPWVTSSRKGINLSGSKRVRKIPTTMEQVKAVLALARVYASRTSAPAGWNPNAPVIGFSTPNPLPHQLRGGALAALQLERARAVETVNKRKREAEEEEAAKSKKLEERSVQPSTVQKKTTATDSKKGTSSTPTPQSTRRTSRVKPQTMNLSDSDSSDEEDSDEE